ncbi:hypothetical protein KIK84_10185 [Curvibacter sp. CHRR-16]|uniref:hypothetical protein n=1 Tax=Curvibacter sp. CHRR-16 TaxID=2835872 RepID=UPI001BDA3E68|nr:hypothetical protein [Curvibacter sp. CHRR-16]MBT0570698.1 hypothetical protein [Curvibacter sp. CHRR-16]
MSTVTIELPEELARALEKEGKRKRKTLTEYLADVVEVQQAERALKKALKANQGKPQIAAQDLYKECGL